MCEGYRNGANLTTLAEDLVELFLGGVEAHVAHVQRRGLNIVEHIVRAHK